MGLDVAMGGKQRSRDQLSAFSYQPEKSETGLGVADRKS
jgi:hypothetical protein